MSAGWFQFRVAARSHGRAWVALGVLVGIAAGVVMVAVAGARRTDSMLDRIVVETRAANVLVNPNNGALTNAQWRALEQLPEVARFSHEFGAPMVPLDRHGRPDFGFLTSARGAVILGDTDGAGFRSFDRAAVVAGRMPSPTDTNALIVNETAATLDHLHVGAHLRVGFFDVNALQRNTPPRLQDRTTLVVAAVVRTLDDATRTADDPRLSPEIELSPPLSRRIAPLGSFYGGLDIELRDPRQLATFEADARRIAGTSVLDFQELSGTLSRARRSLRPYVVTLWVFALLAGLAGAGAVGQIASRQQRAEAGSRAILRALGSTRAEFARVAAWRGLCIGAVATLTAVGVAIAASPLMPTGPFRVLETHRGVDVDVTVIGSAALAILALVVIQSVAGALRRPRTRVAVPSAATDRLARATGSPAFTTGLRFATDPGRGDNAVPIRSTTFGLAIAIATLVATLVFASGLTHFTSTPRMYGWIWSYQIEYSNGESIAALQQPAAHIARSPGVRAVAVGGYAQITTARRTIGAIAIQTGRHVAVVETVSGRAPSRSDELAVGAETLRTLHRSVGDSLTIGIGGVTSRFHIVGEAVFPRFAPYPASEPTGLGVGAAMTLDGLRRFGPLDSSPKSPLSGSPFVLVDAGSGTTSAALARVALPQGPSQGLVLADQRPSYVVSYQHLERTPLALAALLTLLAIATTVHLLVTTVRRRRHDLGTLRALGLTAAQTRSALLVQATTLIALALVVAVPAGIIAGRLLWALTAHWLGIAVYEVMPIAAVAGVAAGALAAGNLAALYPATAAGRVHAAEILRTE